MTYKNTRTGVEVVVSSEILGEWERIDVPTSTKAKTQDEPKADAPAKKARKK